MKVSCAIFVIKMPYQNVLSLSKRGLALKVLSKLLYAIADNKGNNEELKILHQKILNESLNLNELASDSGNDTFRISHRLERLYNVMQKTRHMAEGEKEELQSLVSDISHQTKTPIANLKLINDTMLTRPLTEEKRKELLQATGAQMDKLDFLIQGMVKTSRLETGVITLEKLDAVIGDTLVSAINGVLAPMEQKEISLSVDCPSDLTISHDGRWTSEALFNILDNAVKYTSAGGSIQVKVQDWEMYLRIDVTDTGRGIPEHSQGTIFKRFYRDEAVRDIDGVGIGLYLAREIITMQGGYITVESKVGKGSTFSVFLPIK